MKRSAMLLLVLSLIVATAHADPVSPYKKTGYRDGGVVLRMSVPMGSILNAGEELSFRYQTRQDAFVIVFNIDTEGYVHLLQPADRVAISSARQNYDIPGNGDVLVVSGETGVEFVFALTVPERSFIDDEELAYLRRLDERPKSERYRINGDPFLAANMIAGELVRGISRRDGIYFDYTYFYVNQRVEYPCYLCGECEGDALSTDCEGYRIAAEFDRETPMRYPLRRAYAMIDPGVEPETQVAVEEDRGVNVDFYPYRVEVRYISRPWYGYDWYWWDCGWYDPWYSGWYWYPGCYPGALYGYGWGYWDWGWWCGTGWGVSIGWGWGWGPSGYWRGGWGGYWCSDPYYSPYYRGSLARAKGYKTRRTDGTLRTAGTLLDGRRRAVTRDRGLRIASRDLRATPRRTTAQRRPSGITRAGASSIRSRDVRSVRRPTRISNARRATTQRGRTYTKRAVPQRRSGKAMRGGQSTRSTRRSIDRWRSPRSPRSKSHLRRSTNTKRSRIVSPFRRGSTGKSRVTNRSKSRSRSVKSTTRRSGRGKSRATKPSRSRGSRSKATKSRSSSSKRSSNKSSKKRK